MPAMPVRLLITKIGGTGFFITCGLTHFEQTIHTILVPKATDLISWHMVIIHAVQVITVWMFIYGLYQEYVKPSLTLRKVKK
jgi:hypothetical protein